MTRIAVLLFLVSCRIPEQSVREAPCSPGDIIYQTVTADHIVGQDTLFALSDSMALIVVAQAKFETGNFKSKLFKQHNNAFGMRHPKKRSTKSRGPFAKAERKRGYASYRTIQDSAVDMLLWLDFCDITRTNDVDDYCCQLKEHNYFGSKLKSYSNGLKHYLR